MDENKTKKTRDLAGQILFLGLLLLLWQMIYLLGVEALGLWKSYAFPSPCGVVVRFFELMADGSLLKAAGCSLLRGMTGYVLSVIIGSVLGFMIYHFDYLKRNLRPLIMGVQTLPSICWVPFSILWFGLTEKAILFVVIMGSAFSIGVALDNAISNVPPIYKKAALTMGASQRQLYMKVILPACLPELIAGMKQGWSFAWRALMAGEVMTTSISLGQTLITGRNMADINQVMLVMIVIVVIGILVDRLLFGRLEYHVRKKRGLI